MVITSRLAPPRSCTVGTTPGGGRTRGDLVRCTGEMECRSRVTPLSFRCCRSVHAASPKPVTTLRTNYMLTLRDRRKSRICSSFPPLCLFLYVSVLCVCVSLTLSDAGCTARRFRREFRRARKCSERENTAGRCRDNRLCWHRERTLDAILRTEGEAFFKREMVSAEPVLTMLARACI